MKIKELSKQWGQDIEVNGKSIEVRITIEVSYDEYFNLDDFEPEDRKDIEKKLGRYELTPVMVQVLGHIDGHLFGCDSLGGVLMENKQDIDDIVKDYDMIQNCLNETKQALIEFLKKVG